MKYSFFCLIFLLNLLACGEVKNEEKEDVIADIHPPNIVILFADDLGYGDLGIFGNPTINTPNLDKISSQGLKLTSFYSASPVCSASRYALLTGKYPVRSGFQMVLFPPSTRGIHPQEYTIAELVQSGGYKTACIGKWHLGTAKKDFFPLQNGFDEYYGLPYSNDMIPPAYDPIPLIEGNDTIEVSPDQSKLTADYTRKAISFIERNKNEPFLLYLPYTMPHIPLNPGRDFQGTSSKGIYGDVIEELDWSAGEIMESLKQHNLDSNTLFIFTSDNGPWTVMNERGGSAGLLRGGKGSTWEGGMRVPCIFHWPGKIEPSVSSFPTSTLDLISTIATLTETSIPSESPVDGVDLSFLWDRNENPQIRPFFYYGHNHLLHAVRSGSWKLHIKTDNNLSPQENVPLLFNLDEDPSEKWDRAKEEPEIVAELTEIIRNQEQKLIDEPNYFKQEIKKQEHLAMGVLPKVNQYSTNYGPPDFITDGLVVDVEDINEMTGIEGNDMELELHFKEEINITEIEVICAQLPHKWVFAPLEIEVVFFEGNNLGSFITLRTNVESKETKNVVFSGSPLDIKTNHIKIKVKSAGKCPEWHKGADEDCWIFVNEVILK